MAAAAPGLRGRHAMSGTLHLAKAQSNGGPGGRKKDFPDAEGLVKRLVAQELTLIRARHRAAALANREAAQVPGIRYERGPAVSEEAKKVRARKMIRELRSLGYRVEPVAAPSSSRA